MDEQETVPARRRPTVKQVYALAAELCERSGEEFPRTKAEASELIERLRTENGRPEEAAPVFDRGG